MYCISSKKIISQRSKFVHLYRGVTQQIYMDWTGLDWTGLDWTGLDWTGLDWTGLDWTGLDWTGLSQYFNICHFFSLSNIFRY